MPSSLQSTGSSCADSARAGHPLVWSQPNGFKMGYELRAGDTMIGAMRFPGWFSYTAIAKGLEDCWTFQRQGIFQTRASIRLCNCDAEIAGFRKRAFSGGGELELPHRWFRAKTNLWQSRLEFVDEQGRSLLRVARSGLLRLSGSVEIAPEAADIPELELLVMFGWYLVVMMYTDAAA